MAIDKENMEMRAHYREECAQFIEPRIEDAKASDRAAIDLAVHFIKTGYILNGGGLVALPTAINLFGIQTSALASSVLYAGGAFVIGLVATWITSLCAFFSLTKRGNAQLIHAEVERIRVWQELLHPHDDVNREKYSASEREYVTRKLQLQTQFERWRLSGILCSVLSIVFFIAGNVLGAQIILGK